MLAQIIDKLDLLRASDALYAPISASTTGNNTVVDAVAGRKIRVLSAAIFASADLTAKFKSGTAGADLTGAVPLNALTTTALLSGATGGVVLPYSPAGWCETASGDLLNLVLGGTGDAFGCVVYRLI